MSRNRLSHSGDGQLTASAAGLRNVTSKRFRAISFCESLVAVSACCWYLFWRISGAWGVCSEKLVHIVFDGSTAPFWEGFISFFFSYRFLSSYRFHIVLISFSLPEGPIVQGAEKVVFVRCSLLLLSVMLSLKQFGHFPSFRWYYWQKGSEVWHTDHFWIRNLVGSRVINLSFWTKSGTPKLTLLDPHFGPPCPAGVI